MASRRDEVYERLGERGVNAPAGHFYAIEASRWLGLGDTGAVRAGLAPYTSDDDVDRLLAGVAEIARAGTSCRGAGAVALADRQRDVECVRRPGQRADPRRVVGARRLVREVEVDHERVDVPAEVCALDRVEQVPATAVRPRVRVADRHEQPAAVRPEPPHVERAYVRRAPPGRPGPSARRRRCRSGSPAAPVRRRCRPSTTNRKSGSYGATSAPG